MIAPQALDYASAAACGLLALGTLLRAERSIPRWAFVAGLAVLAVEMVFGAWSVDAPTVEGVVNWARWRLVAKSFLPGPWLLFALTYARGNARDFLARWRYTVAGAFVLPVALAMAFRRDLVEVTQTGGSESHLILRLGASGIGFYLLLLIAYVMVLMNLERTYRASVGTMRWRIKFMLLGLGVMFIVLIYAASQALIYRAVDPSLEGFRAAGLLMAVALIVRSLFRSGHFNLDIYPSHAALQRSATVLVAGLYLLIVGLLANVVEYLGGISTFGLTAFLVLASLVVLAVVLQSDRVRLHLGRLVSRHFQRPMYDYRSVWRKFTEGTSSQVEQIELCRGLVELIADVFQALSVTIWLFDEQNDAFVLAASTSLSTARRRDSAPQRTDTVKVSDHFLIQAEPVDIETSSEAWAIALRRWHPREFPEGGHRWAMPLTGRGELLGLITLGDRIGGIPFSVQDLDVFKCVGDHVGASLLNVRLARRLVQAKEMEAFQTMAAFFVHDLKNAAASLNLTLQNLPAHFDDPAFREDALRTVSKSVAHINHLVGRLGLLRHELKIQPTETDLNELVARTSGLDPATDALLVKELRPLPMLQLDREQIGKVVTNLVLNAKEAIAPDGRITVSTRPAGGWAILTVADNGCGMSPDFMSRSLFRPFQTTKKHGLGIGMFQSKMIVEAHGGRIVVESEPGRGTTFQVFLPLSRAAGASRQSRPPMP